MMTLNMKVDKRKYLVNVNNSSSNMIQMKFEFFNYPDFATINRNRTQDSSKYAVFIISMMKFELFQRFQSHT